ncbi:hypothetical protein Trydic_g6797 [Trypoxylus dichotomus]
MVLGLRFHEPVFIKHRSVPYALKPKIEAEIETLIKGGLSKVHTSDWATPVVPTVKANGRIRLCGDFKVTLNPNLIIDEHPLPTVDDLFTAMAGGIKFSVIDL